MADITVPITADEDLLDWKCPNCGASWSLPLEMTCANHRPEPVRAADLPWPERS